MRQTNETKEKTRKPSEPSLNATEQKWKEQYLLQKKRADKLERENKKKDKLIVSLKKELASLKKEKQDEIDDFMDDEIRRLEMGI